MIKVIIIDDELTAIKSLTWEIENFCDNVEILDSFTNPIESIAAINYLKPDCVFLDIEMPEMDGFQLLKKLSYSDFEVIITTAYDNYAITAFKEGAVDYLLKPIDSDDLVKAIDKIRKMKSDNKLGQDLQKLLEGYPSNPAQQKIALPDGKKLIFVYSEDIMYCKADGNYTNIYLNNDKNILLSKRLKDVEILINSKQFIRVHQSYLINRKYIKEYIRADGQYIILEDNTNIPIARNRKNVVLNFLRS